MNNDKANDGYAELTEEEWKKIGISDLEAKWHSERNGYAQLVKENAALKAELAELKSLMNSARDAAGNTLMEHLQQGAQQQGINQHLQQGAQQLQPHFCQNHVVVLDNKLFCRVCGNCLGGV